MHQSQLHWKQVLDVFYDFDAKKLRQFLLDDHINHIAIHIVICARLYQAGFHQHAHHVWEQLKTSKTNTLQSFS